MCPLILCINYRGHYARITRGRNCKGCLSTCHDRCNDYKSRDSQAESALPLAPDLAKRLEGQLVYEVARRAKIIQIKLASETALLHLGMSGSVRISDHKPNSQPHDHIELTLKRIINITISLIMIHVVLVILI